MKKTLHTFLFIIIILILISSCSLNDEEKEAQPLYPEGFEIFFGYNESGYEMNSLDTYNNIIQKDLFFDGLASVEYLATIKSMNKIYTELIKNEIFDIDHEMTLENISDDKTEEDFITSYKIVFTLEDVDYVVKGDSTVFKCSSENEKANNFKNFCVFMTEFILDTDEYKMLPPVRKDID